jgi:glucose/arabinose dehydrogenase
MRYLSALCVGAIAIVVSATSCSASNSGGTGRSTGAQTGNSAEAGLSKSRPGVRLIKVGSFQQPVYLTSSPGDPHRLFVVERQGRVRVLLDGRKLAAPFLDISGKVGSGGEEQGLLSIAFAPDYPRSGLFYVYYTDHAGNIHVDRLRRSAGDPNTADPGSARTVLVIDHHLYTNHDGGQLQFGPEGDLYVGVGDGGSEDDPAGNGQSLNTLLGKLLRIAPKPGGGYSIPSDNPFVGRPGARPEIWAYGLRNPWRFSFDRLTEALVIGDVGQNQQEEVDFAPRGTGAGANYGWSVFEGDRRNKPGAAPHAVRPVLVAEHSDGYCALIGGYVVRDRALASLYGRYLYGDLCQPKIQAAKLTPGHASGNRGIGLPVKDLASFGQDGSGHIYAVSLDGPVYRLAADKARQ